MPILKAINPFLTFSILMLLHFSSMVNSDTNKVIGSVCSGSDNTTMVEQYQANLNTLLDSLASNAPTHNGFYTAQVSSSIYGLIQCRGDVSGLDCSNCIKNLTMVSNCTSSKDVAIWLRWCFLRYSNASFFGLWDQSGIAFVNDSDYDNSNVISRGLSFMNDLASTAPMEPLMFQVAVLDVGVDGKRYGMAQCTRDISRSDCGSCLYYNLNTFRTIVGNKRDWEIYGSSCSLWFHDFQFYFNFSLPANEGCTRFSPHQVTAGFILTLVFCLLFL